MESNPTFIHIEASSNKQPSFPAEIYWGTIPCEGSTGYGINPEGIAKWRTWDTEFYSIHGLTKDHMQRCGRHPREVCEAINQSLSGKTVYSKAPTVTINLLRELFSVTEIEQCDMKIANLDELFLQNIRETSRETAESVLRKIKTQVAKNNLYLLGGAFEAVYYSEIWKGIDSYNHTWV